MYALLCRFLPPLLAAIITCLWYAILLLLVFALWDGDDSFRYGRL